MLVRTAFLLVLAAAGGTSLAMHRASVEQPVSPQPAPAEPPAPRAAEPERLKAFAGEWAVRVTIWPAPGAEPIHLRGTAANTLEIDGRVLRLAYAGDSGEGGDFAGHGLITYNAVAKRYEYAWIDTESPGLRQLTGTPGPDASIVFTSESADPGTGAVSRRKEVWRLTPDGGFAQTMYRIDAQGRETRYLEVTHTPRRAP